MASFSIVSWDHESARLYITGVSVGDYVRVFARLSNDTSDISHDETITATRTSFYYTVDGLEAETDYAVNVGLATSSTGAGVTWWGGQYFTTDAAITRPDDWYWDSTIASGYEINLTADEWNAFCDRINEFRVYDGLDEYDFTRVYSGDEISAAICNEAWYAINAITGHGTMPSKAVSGGALYASFFTGLRDALNSVP